MHLIFEQELQREIRGFNAYKNVFYIQGVGGPPRNLRNRRIEPNDNNSKPKKHSNNNHEGLFRLFRRREIGENLNRLFNQLFRHRLMS